VDGDIPIALAAFPRVIWAFSDILSKSLYKTSGFVKQFDLTKLFVLAILDRMTYAVPIRGICKVGSKSTSAVKEQPRWADAIRLRRNQLRRSQEEIAARSGDAIHQVKVSRVERGLIHPVKGLSFEELLGLIKALDWTVQEFSQATGLDVTKLSNLDILQRETIPVRRYRIPIVEAGAGLPAWDESGEFVVLDLPELRGKKESELFAVRVVGDSMSPTFLNGDVVVCWKEGQPEAGRVVAVHQHGDGIILKRLQYAGSQPMLYSDNPAYAPVMMGEYDRIYGVVLGMWRPAR